MTFTNYLQTALAEVLKSASSELAELNRHCRRGVVNHWNALTAEKFLETYHYCIAGSNKQATVFFKNWPNQIELFRRHDLARIVAEQNTIRDEWERRKCYLSPLMLNAIIATAQNVNRSWFDFKRTYLCLPNNPESESLEDWEPVVAALDRLPMVGPTMAWLLLRNLFGAPVFKPDMHIVAIANYFFGGADNPLKAMAQAVHATWDDVCQEEHLRPVHLGEVDFILWWYRSNTGNPKNSSTAARRAC